MRDSIIREVEEARERLAARFGYDVRKIAEYLRRRGEERQESHPSEAREKSPSKVSPEGPA